MSNSTSIFVDTSNAYHNGANNLRYDELLRFAQRDGRKVQRYTAYCTYDSDKDDGSSEGNLYAEGLEKFWASLSGFGYKVHKEYVKWQGNGGSRRPKANVDIRMTVDMLTQTASDTILLVTGDGDFIPLVEALQLRGIRVEVMSFLNSSSALQECADYHINGALLPGVIPIQQPVNAEVADEDSHKPVYFNHGEPGSTLTGQIYYFKQENNFGFIRYLPLGEYSNLHVTSTEDPITSFKTVHVHGSKLLPRDRYPSNTVWKFDLKSSEVKKGQLTAVNLRPALTPKNTKPPHNSTRPQQSPDKG